MRPDITARFRRAAMAALLVGAVSGGPALAGAKTQLAQAEERMVCSAGTSFGYVITFGANFSRRLCVTFKWLPGAPTSDAPPPGHCRWDNRAPTRAERKIRVFCQNLPNDFRVEKLGSRVTYKTTDAFYLDRLDDPDFRYFLNVTRQKRIYKVNSIGPWSR